MIIYDEPAAVYHASPAIGSGDVRDFLRSPRLFRDRQDGLERKETPSLLFGQASHMALLEPIRFARDCAFKPEGMNFATTAGKAWKAEQDADGKLIVTHDQAEALQRMHDRMPLEVREIFARCYAEVTVRNEIDGLLLQCRPDVLERDWSLFYDVKTTDRIEDIERTTYKYGYHIQARFYGRVIAAERGTPTPPACRLIFVEKLPPYRWRIAQMDADFALIGDRAVTDALAGIAARRKSGCWEDREDLHELLSPPDWATQEIDDGDI